MNKINWSELKNGDPLYLAIPYNEDGIVKYKYLESYVINIKEYQFIYRLTFKYTNEHNKRIKVSLAINKYKLNNIMLSVSKYTGYARDFDIKYGDFIITNTNLEYMKTFIQKLICNKIEEEKEIINNHILKLRKLFRLIVKIVK